MNIKQYTKKYGRQAAASLAEEVGTKAVYLSQIASGFRHPSRILALALERATSGEIDRHDLRPDMFPVPASTEQDSDNAA